MNDNLMIKIIGFDKRVDIERPYQLISIDNKMKQLLMCLINDVVVIKIIGYDKHIKKTNN